MTWLAWTRTASSAASRSSPRRRCTWRTTPWCANWPAHWPNASCANAGDDRANKSPRHTGIATGRRSHVRRTGDCARRHRISSKPPGNATAPGTRHELAATAHLWIRESAPDTVYEDDLISVWSSAAGDDARRCGLVGVRPVGAGQPGTRCAGAPGAGRAQRGAPVANRPLVSHAGHRRSDLEPLRGRESSRQANRWRQLACVKLADASAASAIGSLPAHQAATARRLADWLQAAADSGGKIADRCWRPTKNGTPYRQDWDDGVHGSSRAQAAAAGRLRRSLGSSRRAPQGAREPVPRAVQLRRVFVHRLRSTCHAQHDRPRSMRPTMRITRVATFFQQRRRRLRRHRAGVAGERRPAGRRAGRAAARPACPPIWRPRRPHFAPRAKAVIHLFMNGGPSQMDLFDPKPELTRRHGEAYFDKIAGEVENPHEAGALMRSPFKFAQHGQCGMWVSDALPHLAEQRRPHRAGALDAHGEHHARAGHLQDSERPHAARLSQHGLVDHLRPGLRESQPAGLRRARRSQGLAGQRHAKLASRVSCRRCFKARAFARPARRC